MQQIVILKFNFLTTFVFLYEINDILQFINNKMYCTVQSNLRISNMLQGSQLIFSTCPPGLPSLKY